MSLATCRKCTGLFQLTPGDAPGTSLCARCGAFAEMVQLLNELKLWRTRVDVVGGDTAAADQLAVLIDRGEALAQRAGAL